MQNQTIGPDLAAHVVIPYFLRTLMKIERQRLGHSRQAASRMARWSSSAWGHFERGTRNLQPHHWINISAAMGIGAEDEVRRLDAFIGTIPGSMGETSTLACLIGAFVLLATGVASWRIMLSVVLGTVAAASLLNAVGSETNPLFEIPFWWHFVIGGLAFATVFIATEPVTAPYTFKGQFIYGFLIGVMVVVVRVLNPAYPDGLLVAILLMNLFSPLIDHYVVAAHIKKRRARHAV